MLLKSIATSQNYFDVEKCVKPLMNFSTQWQRENKQHDMTQKEIRDIVNDVILELKKTQKKS